MGQYVVRGGWWGYVLVVFILVANVAMFTWLAYDWYKRNDVEAEES